MDIMPQSACLVVKPNHGLKLWFPLSLHDGGSGLRLIDAPDLKLSSLGWCLMHDFGLVHCVSTYDFL